jgi:hypothetical protein
VTDAAEPFKELRINQLSREFGGFTALDKLDLDLRR